MPNISEQDTSKLFVKARIVAELKQEKRTKYATDDTATEYGEAFLTVTMTMTMTFFYWKLFEVGFHFSWSNLIDAHQWRTDLLKVSWVKWNMYSWNINNLLHSWLTIISKTGAENSVETLDSLQTISPKKRRKKPKRKQKIRTQNESQKWF